MNVTVYEVNYENWIQKNLVVKSMKAVCRKRGIAYNAPLTPEILRGIREEIQKEENENADYFYRQSQNPMFFVEVMLLLSKIEKEIQNF
jgi:hypothetical protein